MRQRVTAVVLCVCVSAPANLRTGATTRLTEDIDGISGTFVTIIKSRFFLKLVRWRVRSVISLPQLESAILFTLKCFVYSPFHVRTASAIMVPRKHMRVRGYSMCTRVCALQAKQDTRL